MNGISAARREHPADSTIDVWHSRDGWPHRRFRWPAPGAPRGTILYQCGRGDFFEKYLEALTHFHDAGWSVESFDWRGQGLSGRLTDDPAVGHADDFAVWTRDLGEYCADLGARKAGPLVVMGHSMGGHLVLRALAEGVIAPAASVLIAPMLGFYGPIPVSVGARVARALAAMGDPKRAAWRGGEKPGAKAGLRHTLLTHCPDRYADELDWHAREPRFKLGAASWGWVDQAYRSNTYLSSAGTLEAVTTPLLILSATADKLVDFRATARAASRIPHATLHEYGREAAHELLREADRVRHDALARIDAFLAEQATA